MWASWFLSTLELLQQNRSRFKDQISNTSNLSFARMTCKNPAKPVKVTSFLTFKNMSKRDNAENGLAIYAKTMSPTSLSSDKLTTIIPTQTHTLKKKRDAGNQTLQLKLLRWCSLWSLHLRWGFSIVSTSFLFRLTSCRSCSKDSWSCRTWGGSPKSWQGLAVHLECNSSWIMPLTWTYGHFRTLLPVFVVWKLPDLGWQRSWT